MNSCYVVMRYYPIGDGTIDCRLEGLTVNLYLAEKMISNYYIREFGPDGDVLVCTLSPENGDVRTYWMENHFKKKGATCFRVFEQEIHEDSASL